MIHIIVNLWECHGNGSAVRISVRTNEQRVGTQTSHRQAPTYADRSILFEPEGPWCGGAVFEGVPPVHPNGATGHSVNMNVHKSIIHLPQGLK